MKKYTIDGVKIYCQNLLPIKGFLAMAIYGTIFWRKDYQKYLDEPRYDYYVKSTVNHESIHTAQMRDFCKWLPVGGTIFYLVYFGEWIVNLFKYGVKNNIAYDHISFEREAYCNEDNLEYLKTRKKFGQWKENWKSRH